MRGFIERARRAYAEFLTIPTLTILAFLLLRSDPRLRDIDRRRSESMQHQTLAEVYRALGLAMKRLTGELRAEVESTVMRSLSMLGDHALTADLDEAIATLAEALPPGETRSALKQARDRLATTWGLLNSRATRVQNASG